MESCIPCHGQRGATTCRSTLSSVPGGGPRQAGPRRGDVGNRIGWDAGPGGDQGAGGITFAQEMRTAKYDGMPRSAIAANVVDHVLPPAGIARQLAAIARDSRLPMELRKAAEPPGDAELARILRLVQGATGVDLTHYKHSTLLRRIKRRMALRGFETLEAYSRDLEQDREEASTLCEYCFITVTTFFREPAVFEELEKKVFPALVESVRRGAHPDLGARVRHGEEAYSIAICLMEFWKTPKCGFRSRFSPPISAKRPLKRPAPAHTRAPRWRMSRRRD